MCDVFTCTMTVDALFVTGEMVTIVSPQNYLNLIYWFIQNYHNEVAFSISARVKTNYELYHILILQNVVEQVFIACSWNVT